MLDFLKNKKETETKVENEQNESTLMSRELRDKWVKVYTETIDKYPNIKAWLDFKRANFERQLSYHIYPEGVKELEKYIDEVIGMAESTNAQITENIGRFKEFIQDLSPRFVTISAVPGIGMPERE